MSPLLAFKSSWDRIYRAETHRNAFANAWSAFLDENPYSAFVKMESDGTGTITMVQRYDRLPDILALELGETLYQLRAALDSCIYASAIQQSGQDPPPKEKELEFPICDSQGQFRNDSRKISPLSEERRLLVELV